MSTVKQVDQQVRAPALWQPEEVRWQAKKWVALRITLRVDEQVRRPVCRQVQGWVRPALWQPNQPAWWQVWQQLQEETG